MWKGSSIRELDSAFDWFPRSFELPKGSDRRQGGSEVNLRGRKWFTPDPCQVASCHHNLSRHTLPPSLAGSSSRRGAYTNQPLNEIPKLKPYINPAASPKLKNNILRRCQAIRPYQDGYTLIPTRYFTRPGLPDSTAILLSVNCVFKFVRGWGTCPDSRFYQTSTSIYCFIDVFRYRHYSLFLFEASDILIKI